MRSRILRMAFLFGSPGWLFLLRVDQCPVGFHMPDLMGAAPIPAIGDCTMADDLSQTIAENAQGPAKASGDSGSMEQHPLPDQIAADKYLESKKATRRQGLGIGLKKLVPPGTD